ncbi:MAG TPA: PilT/PilU family type 4a pilus ATPase [Acidimicrobiales bacterium]|nr:PilT/PilU family type 4a pilus ATPase [Acidimicrobiales bacterium]
MAPPDRSIGELLVERGVITPAQLEWAVSQGAPNAVAALLDGGIVTEPQVVAAAADHLGVPFADLSGPPPDPALAAHLPEAAARRARAVPIAADASGLTVAVPDPTDAELVAWLARQAGTAVRAALGVPSEIARALDALYGSGAAEASLDELLAQVAAKGASDLHLSVGRPPGIRIDGRIWPLDGQPPLTAARTRALIDGALSEPQQQHFADELELDASYTAAGVGRFRLNAFVQRGNVGAVLRAIPFTIPEFGTLGLPASVATFAEAPRGLVLVTGPTGSGKSTTLASLVDIVNRTRRAHIMTVEDPIEFIHQHKQSTVNQREVGQDTRSFATALRHVLRQDPDVILVGEMRDLETIATALTAAETGHLVFGTLHTQSAGQSVDRIVDVFPAHQQQQVRTQLAATLRGVVTQQLVPMIGGGRAVAAEVLVVTNAVRTLIRDGKTHQIGSTMQSGGKQGMQTMDASLAQLVRDGRVTLDDAVACSHDEDEVRRLAGARPEPVGAAAR